MLLIYRIDLIGDYVISKDFLRLVRNCPKFKDYKIVFLGNSVLTDFILKFDRQYIDEYIAFDRNLFKYRFYKKSLIEQINKYKYDYTFNYMSIRNTYSEFITANINSGKKCGILGLAINLKPEEKAEYDKLYDCLYDVNNNYSNCGLELLNKVTEIDNGKYIHSYNYDQNKLRHFEQKYNKPYAIIFPSASQEIKRMPFEKFMTLAKHLHDKYNFLVYICGSKKDKKIFKKYNIKKPYIKDLCGKYKLSELPYLFKNAKILLTNDTCAMHIANCTQTTSVVFSNVHNFNIEGLKILNKDGETFYKYSSDYNNYVLPNPAYEQMLKEGICQSNISLEYVDIKNAKFNIDEALFPSL